MQKEHEKELVELLGEEKLKIIGEELAELVRRHNLHKHPEICKKLFDYMSGVISRWNCV